MAGITGASKIVALGLGSTFETPVTLTSGDRIEVESYNGNENTSELTTNPVGGGVVMESDSERGSASPSVDISAVVNYDNALNDAVKQFFGTAAISTVGTGVYEHKFTLNETFNSEFLTVADLATSADAIEYPSCVVTSLNYTVVPNDYMKLAASLLANLQDLDQGNVTNDAAALALTTVADTTRVVVRRDDLFQINAQAGGALSGSDNLSITNATISFTKPQEHVDEMRGTAGNGEPEVSSGVPFQTTVTITLKKQENLDFMNAHQDGTEYKARILVTGPVISGSDTYQYNFFLPRLKVVVPTSAPANNAGRNPETITLKALVATAAPTGMDSKYPYVVVQNQRATTYAA